MGCDGRRVLHGTSYMLVYENARATVAARQLSWLALLYFLEQVVCMDEEYNNALSTFTETDKIGHFGRYRYIGKTQISADDIGQADISVHLYGKEQLNFSCPLLRMSIVLTKGKNDKILVVFCENNGHSFSTLNQKDERVF